MKKLLLALLASAAIGGTAVAQNAGTDAFGYTWKASNVAGGPTYNWIDISTTGTPITGLADDNFVGPFDIGFDFPYYLLSYNQLYVGSNGYLSFGQGFTLASGQVGAAGNGFNNLPYAADAPRNNLLAPYLGDLSFVRSNGTPAPTAKAYYQTMGTKFIVTFEAVPWYNGNGAGGISGQNTFQVILDAADTSITYQYKDCRVGYDRNYTAWLVRGFEDINGQYGATISNGATPAPNALPAAQSAVRIKYPATPSVQVTDVRVSGVFNNNNAGEFVYQGSSTSIRGSVQNVGSVSITSPFDVKAVVQDATGNVILTDTVSVPSLNRGQIANLNFARMLPTSATAGSYTVSLTSFLSGDGNAANDLAEAELVVVDTAAATNPVYVLGYDSRNYPQGGTQEFESQNGGVYIAPPSYPARLVGMQFDMGWIRGQDYTDSVLKSNFRIYKDDGPNRGPGTWIGEWTIDSQYWAIGDSVGELNLNNAPNAGYILRTNLYLPAAATIDSGGVYIGVYQDRTTGFFWNAVMRDTEAPFSSRCYEIPGNVWGLHRDNGTFDYAMRGLFSETLVSNKPRISANGLKVSPNPAASYLKLDGLTGRQVTLVNAAGQVVKSVKVNAAMPYVSIDGLTKGVYTLRTDSGQVSRFVKQ